MAAEGAEWLARVWAFGMQMSSRWLAMLAWNRSTSSSVDWTASRPFWLLLPRHRTRSVGAISSTHWKGSNEERAGAVARRLTCSAVNHQEPGEDDCPVVTRWKAGDAVAVTPELAGSLAWRTCEANPAGCAVDWQSMKPLETTMRRVCD